MLILQTRRTTTPAPNRPTNSGVVDYRSGRAVFCGPCGAIVTLLTSEIAERLGADGRQRTQRIDTSDAQGGSDAVDTLGAWGAPPTRAPTDATISVSLTTGAQVSLMAERRQPPGPASATRTPTSCRSPSTRLGSTPAAS